jgi:hypothetical protein
MAYDFHGYIADLMLAAKEARNSGSHGSADMLDDQLAFAVHDAAKAGVIQNHEAFRNSVGQQLLARAGPRLHDILVPPKAS